MYRGKLVTETDPFLLDENHVPIQCAIVPVEHQHRQRCQLEGQR